MSRKKIVYFDITHVAHINLFQNVIKILLQNGYLIKVFYLNRGKIEVILNKEIPGVELIKVANWKPNFFYIIFYTNLFRFLKFVYIFFKYRPCLGVSSGSIPFSFALKLFGVKNLQFSDDPERKISTFFEILSATKKYYPPNNIVHQKVEHYNSLKQWAYLSPKYFSPDYSSLEKYGVKLKKYIIIREVSTKSLNYLKQKENLILNLANQIPNNISVLLSLENKSLKNNYPSKWYLLEEPIENFHSLLFFAHLVISSGDSVAREAAMLGTPSVYIGIREMSANQILIDKGLLIKSRLNELNTITNNLLKMGYSAEQKEKKRNQLAEEWDDLTDFILKKILEYF